MKLKKRLLRIESMVETGYDHIWDCCCDHGLLGAALMSSGKAPNIHFVDIVPTLMDKLELRLKQRFPANLNSHWYTHCIDVATLPLNEFGGRHLVIIAGVGGELTAQLCQAISEANQDLEIDFLLCPVYQQFTLRNTLSKLGYGMKNESLVEDNKRIYEVLLASKGSSQPISAVGCKLWQSESDQQALIAEKYLSLTLNHYRRLQRSNVEATKAVQAYASVTLTQ
ncbi:tRNA (adenine(22)-N(1))-methyltransferase TrmK [Vibrio sp. SCSIO 43135]|uniref:tRNA (adenine(22)-N(1))-methyltransferase n=1 Tax=Vibrio sp. SCSIO 43135 TaxID=2819096 RepID=UPI002075DE7C|nr:tRNA (adenine(22)-N(1))-methyltransferase TrmK [Vibrio sp. SCSIO 43135]USD43170.1 tRNA (adenine(22)-N(1))-methyltransferase TrmK [Vibrio sp. SCSIO 43135]